MDLLSLLPEQAGTLPVVSDVHQLRSMLQAYLAQDELEAGFQERMVNHAQAHDQPFSRDIVMGHFTGSGLILSSCGQFVLLGFHRKLQRWLQMGGHGEPGEYDPFAVALREATEESGINGLVPHPCAPAPLNLDIHAIPARGETPGHQHLDIQYLLQAPNGATHSRQDEEQEDLRWFTWPEALGLPLDRGLQRLLARAQRVAAP